MARFHDQILPDLHRRPDVAKLLAVFLRDFDVTWVKERTLFGAQVVACLLDPERHIRNAFGFEQEVLLVVHNYANVQPRVLHVIEKLLSETPCQGRAEPLVVLLVTASRNASAEVRRLLSSSTNPRIVVPFQIQELQDAVDPYLVRNRLAEFIYDRDLFDVSRPLGSDLYFFGRHSFVLALKDSLKAGENIGLFGLRRTGKTSVLLRLERLLAESKEGSLIYLDLEDNDLYQRRWWSLLEAIAKKLPGAKKGEAYTEENASRSFREALGRIPKKTKVIIALDEIEHITPGDRLRMRPHWDMDFIEFWKTIRAIQNDHRHVTFVVCGTNATPVELAQIADRDNPLFGMVTKRYIPSFNKDEVRSMVRTLARLMGLNFDEECFRYLHERYGGHPFITRQACSHVFSTLKGSKKPVVIPLQWLKDGEVARDLHLSAQAENVLGVLLRWYPMEYEMLGYLSDGEVDRFVNVESGCPELAAHLRGYGLVDGQPPVLTIEFLANYLRARKALAGISDDASSPLSALSDSADSVESDEGAGALMRLAALGVNRNRLEKQLRQFIKRTLIVKKGADKWIQPIVASVPEERRRSLTGVDANLILNERLFLLDLLSVVKANWSEFVHLEQQGGQRRVTKAQFEVLIDFLNRHREDAHAGEIDPPELAAAVAAANTLEAAIRPYLDD